MCEHFTFKWVYTHHHFLGCSCCCLAAPCCHSNKVVRKFFSSQQKKNNNNNTNFVIRCCLSFFCCFFFNFHAERLLIVVSKEMALCPGSFATSSDVGSDHVYRTANADPPDASQVNGSVSSAAVEWASPIPPCFDQGHGGASVLRALDSTPVHGDGASVKLDCAVVGKHMVSPQATSKSLEIGTVDRTLAGSSLKKHRFSEQKKGTETRKCLLLVWYPTLTAALVTSMLLVSV